jgi:hypothetical protein
MALAERHAPVGIAGNVARLGAGPVPAGTGALVVGVFDLQERQRRALGVGLAQVDDQVGLHTARAIPGRQRSSAASAVRGVMLDDVIDGQRLHPPMTGRAGALSGPAVRAGSARALTVRRRRCRCLVARRRRFANRGLITSRRRSGSRLDTAIARACGLVIRCRRWGLVRVLAGPFPRRHAARRTRAVARVAVRTLMRALQVREQLHRQRMQLLGRQCRQRGIVELGEIVFAELHGRGRLASGSLSRLEGLGAISCHNDLDLSASQLVFREGLNGYRCSG